MSMVIDPPEVPPVLSPQESAWRVAEAAAAEAMGTVNPAVARLVAALVDLLAADGWEGAGIRSPEHWVCWKAGVAHGRAAGLVRVARRAGELPACWALFEQGRLGEDAMVRIARRVPACRDAEVAELAPTLLIAQLDRVLRALPEQPDGSTERPEPERVMRVRDGRDGWTRGEFCLPADEGALVRLGLTAARDAEFRDRNDLDPDDRGDAEIDGLANGARAVSWADGLVRMATEAADALDPTFARTGQRSDRNTIVLHVDVDPDGTHGPAQLELAHHIHFWEHGGVTEPSNLTMLCAHHRALHAGEFTIDGDPEAGTLRFLDPWGHPITAPEPRPPEPPPPPTPFTPPLAERLQSDWFTWN